MYLKRVTLQGFKSFADRTQFDFGPGVTGIVGPNGCGKSNVVDAVKWVLGEQSAKSLRGRKMLDVVFNGARARQPADFAFVELTFDNRSQFLNLDQADVSVSRTLYRSGDSEYRLNGNICRLKDIRELFLDTGVAAGAYSIIEQGRVDVLLQASPVERREIFEEAAGISRYRVRRVEAARKLERTQNNLLRLNDVIDELERRVRSVKLQAGKARNYQEYDARLRELRSTFSLAEFHALQEQQQEARAAIEEIGTAIRGLRENLASCDGEASGVSGRIEDVGAELHQFEEQHARLQQEQSTLAERQHHLEQRITELHETREKRQNQAVEAAENAAAMGGQIEEQQEALASITTEAAERAAAIESLKRERDELAEQAQQSRNALEDARTAVFEAVRRATIVHNQQDQLARQRQRVAGERERRSERLSELESAFAAASHEEQQLREDARLSAARSDHLRDDLSTMDKDRQSLDDAHADVGRRLADVKETRAGVLSRLRLLEDLEQRREGVDGATQMVLSRREDHPALASVVVGLVADLLRIDDPRVAQLQVVLAGLEKLLVVRSEGAFLDALREGEALPGPVEVVALDQLPGALDEFSMRDVPGVVGRASDWVQCQEAYRPLAEALLGRVIIVERREVAQQLRPATGSGYTIVTLDGYVIQPNGRLTVGSEKVSAGLISRRAEIRQLETQRDDVETDMEQLTRRQQQLEEQRADIDVQRQALLTDLAEAQRLHSEKQHALTRLETELRQFDVNRQAVMGELQEFEASLREIDDEAQSLVQQAEAADAAQSAEQHRIDEIEQEVATRNTAVEDLSRQLTDALVEVGRQNERQAASEAALRGLERRREELQRLERVAQQEAVEAESASSQAQAALAETNERQTALVAEIAEVAQQMQARQATRQALKSELESCSARGREIQEQIESREASLHERQMALRECEVRQESLVTRTQEELGLDLAEQYHAYEHAEQDWAAVRAEIEDLRGKIARLGNVNLDAIDELEELQPRYENLLEQRDDLTGSVERLEQLIEELDEESRTRFSESFVQIREHFQELFRKLFGGGKADIVLEDPELPLECGIEIIARPPGKEPQSISLLSGGEKTMTAVALLLAVFKSRPSPFAILDEVDAALDEANVGRFNSVVQEFLSHSQFVVITHNKRTMSHADVLYGVTMEETGVSKRVSVRFDDSVDTPNVA